MATSIRLRTVAALPPRLTAASRVQVPSCNTFLQPAIHRSACGSGSPLAGAPGAGMMPSSRLQRPPSRGRLSVPSRRGEVQYTGEVCLDDGQAPREAASAPDADCLMQPDCCSAAVHARCKVREAEACRAVDIASFLGLRRCDEPSGGECTAQHSHTTEAEALGLSQAAVVADSGPNPSLLVFWRLRSEMRHSVPGPGGVRHADG